MGWQDDPVTEPAAGGSWKDDPAQKPPERMVPFKGGMRPATEEEYQAWQAQEKSPISQAATVLGTVGGVGGLAAGGPLALGARIIGNPVAVGGTVGAVDLAEGKGPVTATKDALMWGIGTKFGGPIAERAVGAILPRVVPASIRAAIAKRLLGAGGGAEVAPAVTRTAEAVSQPRIATTGASSTSPSVVLRPQFGEQPISRVVPAEAAPVVKAVESAPKPADVPAIVKRAAKPKAPKAAPPSATTEESMVDAIKRQVLERKAGGFSPGQTAAIIREQYAKDIGGMTQYQARKMVDMILAAEGK